MALHRVLSRLVELAAADPEPARALLDERIAAKLHHGGELAEMDIRLEVPVAQALLPSVERMDLDGAEPIQVVATAVRHRAVARARPGRPPRRPRRAGHAAAPAQRVRHRAVVAARGAV